MGKRRVGIVVIIVLLILTYISQSDVFGENKMEKTEYKKVLVLGIDGMDYKISKGLMAAGRLPTFKKLAESGSFVKLDTSTPPESPVAWVSISTGLNPGKHNIFDFIRRDPQSYTPELTLSKTKSGIGGTNYETYVKGQPFWRLTSKEKIPTTIIRWPVTFPPEEVQGKMFPGLGVPDIRGFLSGYTYYTTEQQVEKNPKIKLVSKNSGIINTEIYGPKTRKGGEIVNIKVPLQINIGENQATLKLGGKEYIVKEGEWSEWIRTEFKVGPFKKISGIFKVHLLNLEKFSMYVTTIQIDPENPVIDFTYPASYSKELAEDIGLYYTLGMPEETDGYVDEKLDRKSFLEQTREIESERDKMFWKEFIEFNKKDSGVFAFVYDTSDRLQHVFWNEKVIGREKNDKLSLNKVVVDYYEEKDKFLAELLERIDDETLLLVISDHGITSFERSVHLNTWLKNNSYLHLTKELEKGEESPLYRYVDWDTTRAYAVGFTSIYLNLEGREGQGIVQDKEPLLKELVTKLENMIDPKTGEKVIHKVYRKEEIYSGEYLKNAPDLILGFKPGYRMSWQTAIGGFGDQFIEDNEKKWNGDHLVDPSFVPGVLYSNEKLNVKTAHQIDVAPTILSALGVAIPAEIDGKNLLIKDN